MASTDINNKSDLNSFKFWKIHTKKKPNTLQSYIKQVYLLAICKFSSFSSIYSLYSEKERVKIIHYFLSISEIQFDFVYNAVCVITENLFQGTGKPIYFLFE
jgi:hypothetical protein